MYAQCGFPMLKERPNIQSIKLVNVFGTMCLNWPDGFFLFILFSDNVQDVSTG